MESVGSRDALADAVIAGAYLEVVTVHAPIRRRGRMVR